jgi:hypothetical protein
MKFVLQPWQSFVVIIASWINRQQQEVIEYLRTENAVLKEKLGKKRILLSDDQRRRLAVKGKVLGRRQLELFGTLFTPDTILRWHRQLVANKWDYSNRRVKKTGSLRNYVRAPTCYKSMNSDTTVMSHVRVTVASAFRTVPEGLGDGEVSGTAPFAEPEQRSANTEVLAAGT